MRFKALSDHHETHDHDRDHGHPRDHNDNHTPAQDDAHANARGATSSALIIELREHVPFSVSAAAIGLIVAGAFASYSLGANNIANVMGVFVPSAPFGDLDVFGLFRLNAGQRLFLVGGIAIAVGVFTYSKRVMLTVGSKLFQLSPISALVVVLAQGLVLFLSEESEKFFFPPQKATVEVLCWLSRKPGGGFTDRELQKADLRFYVRDVVVDDGKQPEVTLQLLALPGGASDFRITLETPSGLLYDPGTEQTGRSLTIRSRGK